MLSAMIKEIRKMGQPSSSSWPRADPKIKKYFSLTQILVFTL